MKLTVEREHLDALVDRFPELDGSPAPSAAPSSGAWTWHSAGKRAEQG